jgi:hypothetical protein
MRMSDFRQNRIPLAGTIQPGDRVEVRRRFDAGWAHGFEVADVADDGVHVRRLSDGEILPVPFGQDDLRREASPGTW